MYNFHTHTKYCDGSSDPEKYVQEAVKQNFTTLGFSGHAPLPFQNNFSLTQENIEDYCHTIRQLQKNYVNQLSVFLAVEADFIPAISSNFDTFRYNHHLDYVIGAVHMVQRKGFDHLWFIDGSKQETFDEGLKILFDFNIQQAVRRYFEQINEMIETEHFEIIAHFDKIVMHNQNRYFKTDEKWYQKLLLETLDLIKEKHLILEINTRGLYKKRYWDFYPEQQWFSIIKEMNIPIIISTDAHDPSELQLFVPEAKKNLLKAGIKDQMIFSETGFKSIPIVL